MDIDVKKLERNVNLHSLQPGFLNSELHYVIASGEDTFRFAGWEEEPGTGEQKFYCFLTEQELFIPSGNLTLKESYVLSKEPAYAEIKNFDDCLAIIAALKSGGVAKAIRKFPTEYIETIKEQLKQKFGSAESHIVKSEEGQHLLIAFQNIDISISGAMLYFRCKSF